MAGREHHRSKTELGPDLDHTGQGKDESSGLIQGKAPLTPEDVFSGPIFALHVNVVLDGITPKSWIRWGRDFSNE